MATTTPTSTLPTTTQPITAMLTQTTTRSTISIAIATIMQNPTFTPNTTLPNITLTLVVTTDRTSTRSLSYLYTNRWAILAGTASGLFVIGAATWILLSYAVQYKRDLLHRRYVNLDSFPI